MNEIPNPMIDPTSVANSDPILAILLGGVFLLSLVIGYQIRKMTKQIDKFDRGSSRW